MTLRAVGHVPVRRAELPAGLGGSPARPRPSLPSYAAGVPLAAPVAGLTHDLSALGPLVPVLAAGVVAAGLGAVVTRGGRGGGNRRRRGRSVTMRTRLRWHWYPGPGFATRTQLYRQYGRWPARRVARFARPSLSTRDRWFGPSHEYATYHGRAQGWIHRWGVYTSLEDLVIMFAPPQEGKSQRAAASIVDAPGPVVVTSIRGDLIAATAGLRQEAGSVHVWNPEGVGEFGSTMRWNPVSGCADIVTAGRRAGYMVEASEAQGLSDAQFWADMGISALAALMHAAGLIGADMTVVYRWVMSREEAADALHILDAHDGADDFARAVLYRLLHEMNDRTADGVITTLSRVLRFMSNPGVVEMLRPPAGAGFDFARFVRSHDTVYLVSSADEGTAPSSALFAAFLAELAAVATLEGSRSAASGGPARLDPPLTIEGDELANTAPVPVDRWASWAAGSGIRIHMYFQTWARVVQRWGPEGARALWGSAKCKVIGSGVTEEALLSMVSRLIGKIEVREADETYTDRAGISRARKRFAEIDIISAADLRRLPRGRALVLRSSAAAPTIVTLDVLRKRREYKRWRRAGGAIEFLPPVLVRQIPQVRPELSVQPEPTPAAVGDDLAARRARRTPQGAPPLAHPTQGRGTGPGGRPVMLPRPQVPQGGPPAGWGAPPTERPSERPRPQAADWTAEPAPPAQDTGAESAESAESGWSPFGGEGDQGEQGGPDATPRGDEQGTEGPPPGWTPFRDRAAGDS